ncbi:DUF6959 family protein [Streptomyces marianii]|uniref:DUF6959 family protein n=1 Tax=Streptomyces marianii TaxID=1817406 RepID=UPI00389A7550
MSTGDVRLDGRMERVEAELFTDGGNSSVVRVPGAAFVPDAGADAQPWAAAARSLPRDRRLLPTASAAPLSTLRSPGPEQYNYLADLETSEQKSSQCCSNQHQNVERSQEEVCLATRD